MSLATRDMKFVKMHQFAFVQKCLTLRSTALPLPPKRPVKDKVGGGGEGGKVNMSTAP